MTTDALANAFRATHYRVSLGGAWLTLEVDKPCAYELGGWLKRRAGATAAWLITAYNPGATTLSPALNNVRERVLRDWARAHVPAYLDSVNRDPGGRWPDEPGLLLAGLEEGLARSLALRFGQLAMLAVRAHAAVETVWLEP